MQGGFMHVGTPKESQQEEDGFPAAADRSVDEPMANDSDNHPTTNKKKQSLSPLASSQESSDMEESHKKSHKRSKRDNSYTGCAHQSHKRSKRDKSSTGWVHQSVDSNITLLSVHSSDWKSTQSDQQLSKRPWALAIKSHISSVGLDLSDSSSNDDLFQSMKGKRTKQHNELSQPAKKKSRRSTNLKGRFGKDMMESDDSDDDLTDSDDDSKKPASKKPVSKKKLTDSDDSDNDSKKPASKKPFAMKPASKKPAAMKPASKKPAAKKKSTDSDDDEKKPASKKPAAKKKLISKQSARNSFAVSLAGS